MGFLRKFNFGLSNLVLFRIVSAFPLTLEFENVDSPTFFFAKRQHGRALHEWCISMYHQFPFLRDRSSSRSLEIERRLNFTDRVETWKGILYRKCLKQGPRRNTYKNDMIALQLVPSKAAMQACISLLFCEAGGKW